MTTTEPRGRLGNQFIRNIAVSFIAEKHDLRVTYSSHDKIKMLGIPLFVGQKEYTHTMVLTDSNYFETFETPSLRQNLYPNKNFFQTKEITTKIYNYLREDTIKQTIMSTNKYNLNYDNNKDLFIHIRLDDVKKHTPGIEYYLKTISMVDFENMYVSTDEPSHEIIRQLRQQYPSCKMINYNETETIQFASTCKNIILSHGSFSAVIGYLSFFSNIYYPEYENGKIWYGDLFSVNDNWVKVMK